MVKNVGDNVDKGEAILELETDKVNVEVVSEEAGVLSEQLAEEGDTVEVGQAVAVVGEVNTSNDSSNESSQKMKLKRKKRQNNQIRILVKVKIHKIIASNVSMQHHLRRHARKNGVDLSEVSGKGNDVLRKDDVENSQKSSGERTKSESKSQNSGSKQSNNNPSKPVIREKMSRRKKLLQKLLEVSNQTAMLTTFNEVDMTNVMDLRKRKKNNLSKIMMVLN